MKIELSRVAARDSLKPRREPYWQRVRPGCFLGYRPAKGGGAGSWIARAYDPDTRKYRHHALGHNGQVPARDRFAVAKRAAEEFADVIEAGGHARSKIETVADSAPSATQTSAKQLCPMAVIKVSPGNSFGHLLVDVLTTSELQRQIDQVSHGGVQKHYLDVKIRNDSGKPVKAFEFSAAYADRMGDESTAASFVSQNDKSIRAGEIYKTFAMDRDSFMQNGKGEVTVFVGRVRFEDNSQWQDNGSRSCGLRASFR